MKPPGTAVRLHCQQPPWSSTASGPQPCLHLLLSLCAPGPMCSFRFCSANDSVLPFCSQSLCPKPNLGCSPPALQQPCPNCGPEPRMEPPARAAQLCSSFPAHKPQLPALTPHPPHPGADSSPSLPPTRGRDPYFQLLNSKLSPICVPPSVIGARTELCNTLKSAPSPSLSPNPGAPALAGGLE